MLRAILAIRRKGCFLDTGRTKTIEVAKVGTTLLETTKIAKDTRRGRDLRDPVNVTWERSLVCVMRAIRQNVVLN